MFKSLSERPSRDFNASQKLSSLSRARLALRRSLALEFYAAPENDCGVKLGCGSKRPGTPKKGTIHLWFSRVFFLIHRQIGEAREDFFAHFGVFTRVEQSGSELLGSSGIFLIAFARKNL